MVVQAVVRLVAQTVAAPVADPIPEVVQMPKFGQAAAADPKAGRIAGLAVVRLAGQAVAGPAAVPKDALGPVAVFVRIVVGAPVVAVGPVAVGQAVAAVPEVDHIAAGPEVDQFASLVVARPVGPTDADPTVVVGPDSAVGPVVAGLVVEGSASWRRAEIDLQTVVVAVGQEPQFSIPETPHLGFDRLGFAAGSGQKSNPDRVGCQDQQHRRAAACSRAEAALYLD